MEITEANFKQILPSLELVVKYLKHSDRRMFLGQLALNLGRGGNTIVSNNLNISRTTLNKGIEEVKQGQAIKSRFNERGRNSLEQIMPELINSIKKIADGASQTDPKFTSTRLYTRLSVSSLRKQLLQEGYTEETLPSDQTLWNKLVALGYKRKKVAKTKPKKK